MTDPQIKRLFEDYGMSNLAIIPCHHEIVPELKVKLLSDDAKLPHRATEGDAGLDIFAAEGKILWPRTVTFVRSDVAVEFPKGYVLKVENKSSWGAKGVSIMGGVIDAGYRGAIGLMMCNHTDAPIKIEKGQKAAQLVLYPIVLAEPIEVADLSDSERGVGGFGSSGSY